MNAVASKTAPRIAAGVTGSVVPLTEREQARFTEFEHTIETHFSTFKPAGEALDKIRSEKLYRAKYSTFEVYCRMRWGMSKTQANRLIAASKTVSTLTEALQKESPQTVEMLSHLTESSVRPLTMLKPAQQKRVISKAMKKAPGGVTAALIQQTAREVAPEAFKRRKTTVTNRNRGDSAGDLVRRSEFLEELTKWETAQKKTGKFDSLKPDDVLREVRRIAGQL